ncbi:MAG: hypothetical protein BZ134_00270 [Methanosphaera sp. SHI1033]|nr:MAG: hypothetical protein BZ134_00270 [Methanosphaera sp. SHI1033]
MVQQYNNTPPREGLEALESDIEFYNMLIDQQRDGDSVLSRFNIVLSAHYEDYDAEEVNTIYVVRGKSENIRTSTEAEWFAVHIQVIIQVSNNDSLIANQILRSTYRRIKSYLVRNPIWGFMTTDTLTPLYRSDGCVSEFVIDFTATEVEEFELYNELDDWELDLCLTAGIDGTDELNKIFPPLEIVKEKIPHHKIQQTIKEENSEEISKQINKIHSKQRRMFN